MQNKSTLETSDLSDPMIGEFVTIPPEKGGGIGQVKSVYTLPFGQGTLYTVRNEASGQIIPIVSIFELVPLSD